MLLEECIEALAIRPDGVYLDGTLGRAGHSREIARASDQRPAHLRGPGPGGPGRGGGAPGPLAGQGELVHSNFCELDAILDGLGLDRVDGMLFDLGVSSPQLDDPSRGFSYMADAPLDMRMDRPIP